MKDQMLVTDPFSLPPMYGDICEANYAQRSFWMELYPPLEDRKAEIPNARLLCPWSMAAELKDFSIRPLRRKSILDAFKTGLSTMRQYNLPAGRILFVEDKASRAISVWVD